MAEQIWTPHPRQEEALKRIEFEVLFGGARGGGKTDTGIVTLTDYVDNPRYRALVLRKNADDLSDWLDRAGYMYRTLKASIVNKPAIIRFPSGAVIRTGHLKDRKSYEKYLGHEYHKILIEELTQIPKEDYYTQIIGSCRSTIPSLVPQVFATANPGGVGHGWVKRRFIDPSAPFKPFIGKETGRTRIYIPSLIEDNPTLVLNDPNYVKYLDGLKDTNPELWKAWRMGDWSVFVGQVFREWRNDKHVIEPVDLPKNWRKYERIIGFDWGYNAPGVAKWWAFAPEDHKGRQKAYSYREIYQNQKTPEEWAVQLAKIIKDEPIKYMVLPHDCFYEVQGNNTIAEVFRKIIKCRIVAAKTLERGARLNRKAIYHQFLSLDDEGNPGLRYVSTCRESIRSIPELVYSDTNPEDVETDSDDHCYDADSTALMTWRQLSGTSGGVKQGGKEPQAGLKALAGGAMQSPDFIRAALDAQHRRKGNPEGG